MIHKSWREMYIKILTSGPDEAEFQYAAELIDKGYASGSVVKNNTGMGNPIARIAWNGPTTTGREYIDDLREKISRKTLIFKVKAGALALISTSAGMLIEGAIKLFNCP